LRIFLASFNSFRNSSIRAHSKRTARNYRLPIGDTTLHFFLLRSGIQTSREQFSRDCLCIRSWICLHLSSGTCLALITKKPGGIPASHTFHTKLPGQW
jgi:hypothetical protein